MNVPVEKIDFGYFAAASACSMPHFLLEKKFKKKARTYVRTYIRMYVRNLRTYVTYVPTYVRTDVVV